MAPASRRNSKKMQGKSPSVRVRMYRQGLGDCFLVTFQGVGAPFHVLFDCGVLLGTQDPQVIMQAVANDIQKETGGRLDLLVATHEHWDHLSGFVQAQEIFDKIHIDQIWMGWTEDPANPTAQQLRGRRAAQIAALRQSLTHLPPALDEHRQGLEEILGFFGEPLGAAGGNSTRAALDYLSNRSDARIRYCTPGMGPLGFDNLPGVRLYVLGPPTDLDFLKRSDPTKTGHEVYEELTALTLEDSFFAAASQEVDPDRYKRINELCYPFDTYFQVSAGEAAINAFFRQTYGFDDNTETAPSWRRIDSDWLGVADEFALKLDSDTNNTSLVLAIELVDSGRVLLFPADAQVGSWLSWGGLTWQLPGQTQPVSSADLLKRTVLYKVGHHGSHNATLREAGLELMTSPDLVAMIPVNHTMAVKKRWDMPFSPLLDRLGVKTRGRVIRIDDGLPKPDALARLSQFERDTFQACTQQTDLYVDYSIS